MNPAIAFFILISMLNIAAQFEHKHDPILPAPEEVWNGCCHDSDCVRAEVSVMRVTEGFMVAVAEFPIFFVPASKVHISQNGKSYICTFGKQLPPTTDNVVCVFIVRPNSV
jgi:hypothetical protein